jgi:hypothetical protein
VIGRKKTQPISDEAIRKLSKSLQQFGHKMAQALPSLEELTTAMRSLDDPSMDSGRRIMGLPPHGESPRLDALMLRLEDYPIHKLRADRDIKAHSLILFLWMDWPTDDGAMRCTDYTLHLPAEMLSRPEKEFVWEDDDLLPASHLAAFDQWWMECCNSSGDFEDAAESHEREQLYFGKFQIAIHDDLHKKVLGLGRQ